MKPFRFSIKNHNFRGSEEKHRQGPAAFYAILLPAPKIERDSNYIGDNIINQILFYSQLCYYNIINICKSIQFLFPILQHGFRHLIFLTQMTRTLS